MPRDYARAKCSECGRVFDLTDAAEADEWGHGHDCEASNLPREDETYGIADALRGGPGLDGYAYQADVYCVRDGRALIENIFRIGTRVDWLTFCDSERVPQPIFFADSPEYCAACDGLIPTGEA